jgi:DNA segregation ATPase FtsK/SpoIIIE, S-DNA-T family
MRILAPIPGKNVIGFEIANQTRDDVSYGGMIASKEFKESPARLPMILGVDIAGTPVTVDLASMPHLLVGGATGSGKSVGLNVMLMSLLCKETPDDLKLILIDPKRLEFTPYSHIPHLLFPIVTQPARASAVLAWVVQEMETRYDAMAAVGVRGFSEYKKLLKEKKIDSEGNELRSMPYLVVIIDELADLMIVAGKEVEGHIVRIAQMARAAGIHMIVATQRPSVDVVTGLIKVNFPSRIAFRVSSKVDSRAILDSQGAEKLIGRGDMLFMHGSSPELKRIHGALISDGEVERVADFLREQRQPNYLDINEVLVRNTLGAREDIEDELYTQVRDFVLTLDEISISMLQRQYRIGFNRSARLIEKLELDGFLAPAQGSKPRKVIR